MDPSNSLVIETRNLSKAYKDTVGELEAPLSWSRSAWYARGIFALWPCPTWVLA